MAARTSERSRMVKKVKGKEARTERTSDVRRSLYLRKVKVMRKDRSVPDKSAIGCIHRRHTRRTD